MSRGRPKNLEVEILNRMPVDILLQMTNKEVSEVFGVNQGQVSTIMTNKLEYYTERKQHILMTNEKEIECHGAWKELKGTELYKQLTNGRN